MRRALRPALGKSIANRDPRILRVRPSPPELKSGHINCENTRRRLSKTSTRLVPLESSPKRQRDGAKSSRFSRLVNLVEDMENDDQSLVAGSYDHRTEALRGAFRNTPLFSSAAYDSVESVLNSSPTGERDTELVSQYGLVGALQNVDANDDTEQMKADIQDRLVLANLDFPWSALICGSKGSGKSYTLACLLENALMLKADADENTGDGLDPSAGKFRGPPAAIIFHYNTYAESATTRPCQAADLSFNGKIPVRVLVSASNSNIWAMKHFYDELPGPPGYPPPRVEPLYLYDRQLTTDRILRLMVVEPSGAEPSTDLSYLDVIRSILRDMTLSGSGFTYARFREKLVTQNWTREQRESLNLRLERLEKFIEPDSEWNSSSGPAIRQDEKWDFQPGSLTIVDLSDPFLDPEDAFALFSVALSIFMEGETRCGRIVAMDDAHGFLTQTVEGKKLTEHLVSVIRQQKRTDTHVMIATQEPAACPELMKLSDATFIHRTLSPEQVSALQTHVDGDGTSSKPQNGISTTHERQLSDRVARLQTGESLVFCPAARLAVQGGQEGVSSPTIDSVPPLGSGVAKVRVRRRLTAEGSRFFTAGNFGDGAPPSSYGEEVLLMHALSEDDVPSRNDVWEQNDTSDWGDILEQNDISEQHDISEQNDSDISNQNDIPEQRDDSERNDDSDSEYDSDWDDDDFDIF